jgi:hypothetical protein
LSYATTFSSYSGQTFDLVYPLVHYHAKKDDDSMDDDEKNTPIARRFYPAFSTGSSYALAS